LNINGAPIPVETPGREICIDAPITSTFGYYRFSDRAILQWVYNPPSPTGPPPPAWFGWKSVYDNGLFNLAGPKDYRVSADIHQHALMSLGYEGTTYLDFTGQVSCRLDIDY